MQSDALLDPIDRAILRELQVDGRVSNLELAQRIHLSPSACLRRVKRLEDSRVIARYVALVDPKAVGQPGTSYTIVNLERLTKQAIEAFERDELAKATFGDSFHASYVAYKRAEWNDYCLHVSEWERERYLHQW